MNGSPFGHTFRTRCVASDVKGLGIHRDCGRPALYAACAVCMGMVSLCVPSHLAVSCCGSHASSGKSCPVYLTEKPIQELWAKECVSFLEARKKVLASSKYTRNQSYTSAFPTSRATDAASHTLATPTTSNPISITASRVIASSQTEAHSNPVVTGMNICSYRPPAHRKDQYFRTPQIL